MSDWEIYCQVCGRSSLDGLPDNEEERCKHCGQAQAIEYDFAAALNDVVSEKDPAQPGHAIDYSLEMYNTFEEENQTMVDLGGGMVVPLRELLEDGV